MPWLGLIASYPTHKMATRTPNIWSSFCNNFHWMLIPKPFFLYINAVWENFRLQYVRCNTNCFPQNALSTSKPDTHENLKKNKKIQTCEIKLKNTSQNAFTQYTKYTTDERGSNHPNPQFVPKWTDPLIVVSVYRQACPRLRNSIRIYSHQP